MTAARRSPAWPELGPAHWLLVDRDRNRAWMVLHGLGRAIVRMQRFDSRSNTCGMARWIGPVYGILAGDAALAGAASCSPRARKLAIGLQVATAEPAIQAYP